MIFRDKILAQLHEKRARFREFNRGVRLDLESHSRGLQKLMSASRQEVLAEISHLATPGAIPTAEFDDGICRVFPRQFRNHAEARVWAAEKLLNHITLAADGSQILPVQDFSIPIAAIQAAWFVNHHTPDGTYVKDTVFEILTPDDLVVEFDGDRRSSEQAVNLKRFELEVNVLCTQMEALNHESLPLALLDSSLVITFADKLPVELRDSYVAHVMKLLRCSTATRVPLVGYIDTSYSSDLTHLVENYAGIPHSEKVHDARLAGEFLSWGDRTPVFVCARGSADRRKEGVLEAFEEYRRGIGFTYLRTTASSPPARLEFPLWIYEQGLLGEVVDLIRAEVIVGNGYPYVLETADAAAVITGADRDSFYAMFQKFAAAEELDLKISQKAASKWRRR